MSEWRAGCSGSQICLAGKAPIFGDEAPPGAAEVAALQVVPGRIVVTAAVRGIAVGAAEQPGRAGVGGQLGGVRHPDLVAGLSVGTPRAFATCAAASSGLEPTGDARGAPPDVRGRRPPSTWPPGSRRDPRHPAWTGRRPDQVSGTGRAADGPASRDAPATRPERWSPIRRTSTHTAGPHRGGRRCWHRMRLGTRVVRPILAGGAPARRLVRTTRRCGAARGTPAPNRPWACGHPRSQWCREPHD